MNTPVFLLKRQGGFTLTELLVALVIGSVSLAALVSFFRFQIVSLRIENARWAAQVTARGSVNFITRNLEHIGRDPQGQLFTAAAPAIQEAEADNIHYLTNLSDDQTDNDTSDTWEDVTFKYDADTQAVVVDNGEDTYALTDNGAKQKSYIPAGGLSFTYFDGDGNIVAPGGDAAARASIRRINVSITVRGVPPYGAPEPQVTLSQEVFLRNVS